MGATADISVRLAGVRSTLGLPARHTRPRLADLRTESDTLLQTAIGRLAAQDDAATPGQLIAAADAIADIGEVRQQLWEHRVMPQRWRRRDVQEGLGELAAMGDSATIALDAGRVACSACGVQRAMVARIQRGYWMAVATHGEVAGQPPPWPEGRTLRLVTMAAEHAASNERRPRLIDRDGPDGRPVRYILAPVTTSRRCIGFVYADHGADAAAVDEVDRDVLGAFASGLGMIIERAALLARLHEQRREVRRLLVETGAVFDHPGRVEGPASVSRTSRSPTALFPPPDADDDLLTARQREVLSLMARGATSAKIAAALDISEGTVKTHAKNILARLSARSRSEAVSRYLILTAERQRARG